MNKVFLVARRILAGLLESPAAAPDESLRRLARLDDRLLEDIGSSRAAVEAILTGRRPAAGTGRRIRDAAP